MNPPDALESLNTAQRAAYDAIATGRQVFLTGPGGTGKSYLLNLLFTELPKKTGKSVALTALTGCAALLLHPKAKTLHSWAGIGLARESVDILVAGLRKSRRACLRWLQADILVIDEVSMMTPELFEKLDAIGRKIRRNEHVPFGGLQLVLVGDFYQLPPVVRQDGDEKKETSFVFESPIWSALRLETHELTEIVRQKDPMFQEVLNEARRGELSKKSLKILARRMGLDYSKEEIKPTMLFTRRAQVDDINMSHLRKLTTERRTFKATTLFCPSATTAGLTEKDPLVQKGIAKLDNDAPYSPELTLAIDAQVMLITNLNPELGLVNGSRGVVIGYGATAEADVKAQMSTMQGVGQQYDPALQVPIVKFRNGVKMPIAHATWEVPEMPSVLRRQIPLKLAYAVTIHKAQGATLDCALIDVGGRTFEYGQAYVALSRVKNLESLYVHDLEQSAFRVHDKVKKFYASTPKSPDTEQHTYC
jgi:ATP-dependent DNA helicase PIF1